MTNNVFSTKKIAFIGFWANVFEWYEFSVYAFLASVIGMLFFTETNPQLALIKTFLIFSLSYLIRPLGSIVFGYIADNYGRSISFKITLMLMAAATFLIGILPTYATIGYWAVALLVLLRLLQGFAAGGQLPVSTCYVYEISPDHKKNFFGSFVASSSMAGMFLGSLVATLMYNFLSYEVIYSWAWRVPFLISLIIAMIIYTLRSYMTETDDFNASNNKSSKKDYIKSLLDYKKQIGQVFLLNAFTATAFYLLFIWMPSYLIIYLGISPLTAYFTNSTALLILIVLTLITGYMSKPQDTKKYILLSIVSIIILTLPLFTLLNCQIISIVLLVQIAFAICLSFVDGVINATMGSLFPAHIRCGGVAIGFTLSIAIFGGLMPTLASILIYKTGALYSPAILIILSAIIAIPAALTIKTTKHS